MAPLFSSVSGELDRVVRKDRRALWGEPTFVTRGVWLLSIVGVGFSSGMILMLATTPHQVRCDY
jgi:hypothetical protein